MAPSASAPIAIPDARSGPVVSAGVSLMASPVPLAHGSIWQEVARRSASQPPNAQQIAGLPQAAKGRRQAKRRSGAATAILRSATVSGACAPLHRLHGRRRAARSAASSPDRAHARSAVSSDGGPRSVQRGDGGPTSVLAKPGHYRGGTSAEPALLLNWRNHRRQCKMAFLGRRIGGQQPRRRGSDRRAKIRAYRAEPEDAP